MMALDFIAGCLGGCAGIVVGHPFDTVKVKLQTQDYRNPVYRGSWDIFTKVLKTESVSGLYRGIASPLSGIGVVNAMVLSIHSTIQHNQSEPHNLRSYFMAGAVAGLAQSVVASPLELIKTRAQTSSKYVSVMACLKHIYLEEGLRGLFNGMGITTIREFIGYGLYFATFKMLTQRVDEDKPITTMEMLLAGGLSGTVSWVITHPLDVVKTRIQANRVQYSGVFDCFKKSISTEGFGCLTRGMAPNLLRVFPTNAATFTVVTWVFRLTEIISEKSTKSIANNNMILRFPSSRLYCLEDGANDKVAITVIIGNQPLNHSPILSDILVDDGTITNTVINDKNSSEDVRTPFP